MAKAANKKPPRKGLKRVEEKLREQREELLAQKEAIERAKSEESGTPEADVADVGLATFNRERDLSLMENIRGLLDQIEEALERIEKGNYGSCESCGKKIEAARLKALPYASLCIECKKREARR